MVTNCIAKLRRHFTCNKIVAQGISARAQPKILCNTLNTRRNQARKEKLNTHREKYSMDGRSLPIEHPYRGFVNKWPSFHDRGELRLLQHFSPLIKNGVKHALLPRSMIDLPTIGKPLHLTRRALGDTPSMHSLACLVKNK